MIRLHGDVLVNLESVSVKAAFVAGEHLSLSGLCGFFLSIAAWLVVGGQLNQSSDATINT